MASEQEFFVIEPGPFDSTHDTEFGKAEPVFRGEAPRCGVCGLYLGMRPWLPPHRAFLILHGDHYGDFAFASSTTFLVSARAKAAFEEASLTGVTFSRVEVTEVRGHAAKPPPAYSYVPVPLTGTRVDEERSSIKRSGDVTCDACGSDGVDEIHGFGLQTETWTGEDIFFARRLPGVAIVTSKFKDVVKSQQLTNTQLFRTDLYRWAPGGGSAEPPSDR